MVAYVYRVLPFLTLLRGNGWESKHWHQLFSILGLKCKQKTTLSLRDFLASADAIAANTSKIKELNAQAHAEAVIRKALDELDLWGLQRKFQLLESSDSSGGKVRPLCKHEGCLHVSPNDAPAAD
jgi:hypothetical protein